MFYYMFGIVYKNTFGEIVDVILSYMLFATPTLKQVYNAGIFPANYAGNLPQVQHRVTHK